MKKIFLKISLGLTIAVMGVLSFGVSQADAVSLRVTGHAFSGMPTQSGHNQDYPNPNLGNVGQGTGWMSMTSDNHTPPGAIPYGVIVDDATGVFSGYAWNEDFGWVDFSGARLANSSCLTTKIGTSGITGTIKFLSADQPQSGGWDGIVDMYPGRPAVWNNAVTVNCVNGELSGWGWGDYVVGWVDFSDVKINYDLRVVDVCPDNPTYPETLGIQTSVPAGFILQYSRAINTPPACVPDQSVPPSDGSCGSAHRNKFTTAPTTNLCDSGILSNFSGNGPWTWLCLGTPLGVAVTANCSADIYCDDPDADNYNALSQCSYTALCKRNPSDPRCVGGPGGPLKPIYKEN